MEMPEAIAKYIERMEHEEKSEGTIKQYSDILDHFSASVGGCRLLESITIDDIRKFLKEVSCKKNPKTPIAFKNSASFIALHLSAIKSFLDFAKKRLKIKPVDLDDVDDLRPRKIKQKDPGFLLPENIATLKTTALQGDPGRKKTGLREIDEKTRQRGEFKRVRDMTIISLLNNSGLRAAEFLGICSGDLSDGYVKNEQTGVDEKVIFVTVTGKGDKDRKIPLNEEAVEDLYAYLEARAKYYKKKKKKAPDELFPIAYSTLHRLLGQVSKWAGIKHTHPHLLRHTCATTLLKQRVQLTTIQKLLGHSDIKTTTRYTKTLPIELVQAVNQMPKTTPDTPHGEAVKQLPQK